MLTTPRYTRRPSDGEHTAPIGLIIVAAGVAGILMGAAVTGSSVSPLVWYITRAAGFTLYLLLWLSIVTGLGLTTKLLDALAPRTDVWMLHRFITELAFVFLGLHVLTLAIDPTVGLGAVGVLLPWASGVRQPWTGIGIAAGWGMIGVAGSFALRRVLGQRGWRLLHYSAFPLWIMALAHGIGAGTDSSHLWALFLYTFTAAIVLFLSLFRLLMARFRHARTATTAREGRRSSATEGVTNQG